MIAAGAFVFGFEKDYGLVGGMRDGADLVI